MKRSPLKRKASWKPLKKTSTKRGKQLREYAGVRHLYLLEHPTCESCWNREAEQVHHKKGRIGSCLNDVGYFLAVCDACHDWIHNNPDMARKRGFLIDRLSHD